MFGNGQKSANLINCSQKHSSFFTFSTNVAAYEDRQTHDKQIIVKKAHTHTQPYKLCTNLIFVTFSTCFETCFSLIQMPSSFLSINGFSSTMTFMCTAQIYRNGKFYVLDDGEMAHVSNSDVHINQIWLMNVQFILILSSFS